MAELSLMLRAAKTPHDKERIPREIDTADEQIDHLVYELYGLTDAEIRIVEEATTPKATEDESEADQEALFESDIVGQNGRNQTG